MKPNNVTRLLDAHKIRYAAFDLPAEKIGALEAAQFLGVLPELVYKTIVVIREKPGKPLLVLIPGPKEVDLKLLAKALGEKKVLLPTQRDAERLTGLLAGGISPLALIHKGFQVIIDESARSQEMIYISGGQRGLNIQLPVDSLAILTNATFESITR